MQINDSTMGFADQNVVAMDTHDASSSAGSAVSSIERDAIIVRRRAE
jgi:hypothetical protein